ncbi:MAG TPA: N-acetylmuramoyl-L-alanine amidase, partial [Jiangellaceae bacterium]|nr:N-acetylmuramoyl-L-alanine amidase [Jiangellaceae bacterium]
VWIGESDGIQVHVAGGRPDDLTMVLLHPAPLSTDAMAPSQADRSGVPLRRGGPGELAPQPTILTRQDWGANESWRDDQPRYNSTVEQVHVHHTVSSNDYARADVPAMIRGMYRYHTANLGWSDLAYNFLVDRFGRVWEGRAGGVARSVRGAHTLGFNATSTGVSAIGNFDLVSPTSAMMDAIAGVAAWKLDEFARSPLGRTQVRSEGSDRFRAGRVVELPVIDGHRDTNDTACPGRHLYAALPVIRERAQAIVDQAGAGDLPPVKVRQAATLSGAAVVGATLFLTRGRSAPSDAVSTVAWLRNGVIIPGAVGDSYQVLPEDVGTQLAVQLDIGKPGYQTTREVVSVVGLATARTSVSVSASSNRRRVLVQIEVTAPGITPVPTGQVTVMLNGRTRVLDLADGRATVKFFGLPPRQHGIDVSYSGSTTMLPSLGTATVVVT